LTIVDLLLLSVDEQRRRSLKRDFPAEEEEGKREGC